jgi:D-alanyl-D-alanine dipeptidase
LQGRIQENHDALVKVTENTRLKCHSMYHDAKIDGALPDIWLRQGTVSRLEKALGFLPEHLGFRLLDGWRPFKVQTALRDLVGQELLASHPELNAAEFERLLNQFVAQPRQDLDSPSPHLTGGSVDLTLFDIRTGATLDLGTAFDSPELDSWTAAFEDINKDEEIRRHRRYLFNAMTLAGFTNLPTEWWHFDFGNQLWAYYSNEPYAIYSATEIQKINN